MEDEILKIRKLGILPRVITPEIYEKFFENGAIRKKDLNLGKTYIGICRNTERASWDGEKFTYTRYKFGSTFEDKINHFEDDNGYDLFIPVKEI